MACVSDLPPLRPAVRAGPPDGSAPLDAVLGGDLLLAVEAVRPVLVVLVEVLGSQLQAVGAAGHRGGVVREDRGQALGPAEQMVIGGVVDHAILFVRRVVRLRPLAQQRRRVKVF